MQSVNLLARLSCFLLRLAGAEVGRAMETPKLGEVRNQELLLLRDLLLDLGGRTLDGSASGDLVHEGERLQAGVSRCIEHGGQIRVRHDGVDRHGDREVPCRTLHMEKTAGAEPGYCRRDGNVGKCRNKIAPAAVGGPGSAFQQQPSGPQRHVDTGPAAPHLPANTAQYNFQSIANSATHSHLARM